MYQSIPAHNPRLSPEKRSNSDQSYVQSIDGLRGVAVLIVVFFHAGVPVFEIGGYYGVDIFFVISGYIITKSILKDFNKKSFRFSTFYSNRFLRLFPPLFCVGLTLLLVSTILGDTSQAITDIGATFGHIANWTRAYALGVPKYLGHTWSLSIEEQYYLIWPVLLFFSYRHGGPKLAAVISIVLAISSILARIILTLQGETVEFTYNATTTRSDGLFLGCALALWLEAKYGSRSYFPLNIPWPAVAIAALIFAVLLITTPWTSDYARLLGHPAAGVATAIILAKAVSTSQSKTKALLELKSIRGIGLISYSLYLWHYPIFLIMLIHLELSYIQIQIIGIPLSIALAAITYKYVEHPCRRLRHENTARHLNPIMGPTSVAFTISCITLATIYFFA